MCCLGKGRLNHHEIVGMESEEGFNQHCRKNDLMEAGFPGPHVIVNLQCKV